MDSLRQAVHRNNAAAEKKQTGEPVPLLRLNLRHQSGGYRPDTLRHNDAAATERTDVPARPAALHPFHRHCTHLYQAALRALSLQPYAVTAVLCHTTPAPDE